MICEPIEEVLNLTGVEITLERDPEVKFNIFPGFDFDFLANGRGSSSNAERQSFSFQGSSHTIVPLDIKLNETFIIRDTINIYRFKVNTNPIPDITGWHRIFADFVTTTGIILPPSSFQVTS